MRDPSAFRPLLLVVSIPFASALSVAVPASGLANGPIRPRLVIPEHQALRAVHADPPVYCIEDLLSEAECDALIEAARSGALGDQIDYGDEVKLRWDRLTLLLPLVGVGTVGLTLGADYDLGVAFVACLGLAGGLVAIASKAASALVSSGAVRCFTGTKWNADGADVSRRFASKAAGLFGVGEARLEPVTVTRYRAGEFQQRHLDARPLGDTAGLQQFLASGGQRLAQIIVYLQAPTAGGETRFHGAAFGAGGLAVEAVRGRALVFPTACSAVGTPDERYVHSGEAVGGGEKWIVGTWLMEAEREQGSATKGGAPAYEYE